MGRSQPIFKTMLKHPQNILATSFHGKGTLCIEGTHVL